ncbi:MAG: DUF4013 domain-containing protein [Anaerolineae bacterium]
MDIGKSFSYIFEDPRWTSKIAIGTLIMIVSSLLSPVLVGILGYLVLAGYALEVLRNVRNGEKYPMPEWQDRWGEWLTLGAKGAAAMLVWALPLLVVAVPMTIGFALMDNNDGSMIGNLVALCFGGLATLWGIVFLLVSPAISIRVAETEEIASAIRFGDILSFTRQHIGEVIVASLVYLVGSIIISLVAGLLGVILCLVGVIITAPAGQWITMLVQAHLYAQVGRNDKAWSDSTALDEYVTPVSKPATVETPDGAVSISIDPPTDIVN